jgi:protein O-GlcNAc transferase
MTTIRDALQLALQHHQAGRLLEAEQIYRQILQADPTQADAWHLLGAVAHQRGLHQQAAECMQRALDIQPNVAAVHANLGQVYQALGKLDEAATCYRRALELAPDYAEALSNLASILQTQGSLEEAIDHCRRAVQLKPALAEAHNNLGHALRLNGKLDQAVASLRRALKINPELAEAHNNLGVALQNLRRLDDAETCFRQALRLKPEYAEAWTNLGHVLTRLGKLDDAVACCQDALRINPLLADAHNNLGNAWKEHGELDQALACYRRAIELTPENADAQSNLLYTLHFSPDYDARAIYDAHRRWNTQHAEPLARFVQPHPHDRSPDRRLRIGYVSPDFNAHPVGRFLLPLLESHDHQAFESYCYASVHAPDAMTDRCRAAVDVWQDVLGWSDERVADAVREDRIDILVDLTMHMANRRLLVFARKPSPVQVTYLAYCGTTGLIAIDYRLSDPYLDPTDDDQPNYSERTFRLPETYWCYQPLGTTPAVNALPSLSSGPMITFGCLNNFAKVTQPTLATWSRILQAVPESRLLLHCGLGSPRERVRDFLARQNVAPERMIFTEMLPTEEYYRLYQQIDVALDPFPYVGGTTTCDALWMGVPVVSLVGKTAVGRGGLSLLSNVGLPELAANDPEQYVRIAVELAGDRVRLSAIRATLRDRMQNSPLTDAPRFARHIEGAYRTMWQEWCSR